MTPWSGRRVLVTGAGGFIGSHVAGRLLREGAEVRAFLRYGSRESLGALAFEDADAMEVRFGNLRDPDSVERAAEGCDVIVHLGAQISVPYSYVAPREVLETNALGTLNVLLAARRSGAAAVACVSTSEVYGTPETVPILEGHRLNAQSPYAASKVAADMLALSFHASYGVPVGLVRPFNTYGPRQSARAVIPAIVSQALSGGPLRLGALHTVRDFTYVEDTAAGVLAFAASDQVAGRVVQLGAGTGVTVGEVVELVGEIVGRALDVEQDEQRLRPPDSEVQRLVCDPGLARELLGWQPQTALRDGLERTVEWVDAHRDRFEPGRYAI